MRRLIGIIAVAAMTIVGTASTVLAGDNPDGTYTVEEGDSLSRIVADHDAPSEWWRAVAADNDISAKDADLINVGQVLDLRALVDEFVRWVNWHQFDHDVYDVLWTEKTRPQPAPRPAVPSLAEAAPDPPAPEPPAPAAAPAPQPAPQQAPQPGGGFAIPDYIVQCESGGNYGAVNGSNPSRPAGAYQIITSTWLAYGGGAYAPTADAASPAQQDEVASRIWDGGSGAGQWACS